MFLMRLFEDRKSIGRDSSYKTIRLTETLNAIFALAQYELFTLKKLKSYNRRSCIPQRHKMGIRYNRSAACSDLLLFSILSKHLSKKYLTDTRKKIGLNFDYNFRIRNYKNYNFRKNCLSELFCFSTQIVHKLS